MGNVYIIAEAGVNHNGKVTHALKLCHEALKAGADAVKFQTFKTEKVLTRYVKLAAYQKKNIGIDQSQFDMIKKLELSYKDFKEIKVFCDKIGIDFLSTPAEEESLEFLISLGLETIKIGSGEINNLPYLRKVGQKHKDIILSTGMATLAEVKTAFETLSKAGSRSVALLHCTTNYPCLMNEVNLRAMGVLKDTFKTKVGYSDHTLGIEVSIAAVAMGAEIIEKHFTLDKHMIGPDHKASLDPQALQSMITAIRHIEKALGDGIKKPQASEIEIMKVVKKSIVASKRISKGDVLTEKNITVKRAVNGISSAEWDNVIGRKAVKNYDKDECIEF
ncbi:MAG: N-acetylneuraminate synthase [bacterium]